MDGVHCSSLIKSQQSASQYQLSVNGHGNNREEQCTHNPNMWLYRKMEAVIKKMQDPLKGVPIKTVSTFMYKIPSVFSGKSLL